MTKMVSFPERGWPERNGSPVRNLTGHFTMASVGVWKDSDLTWSPASRESPHLDFFFPQSLLFPKFVASGKSPLVILLACIR